MVNEEDLELCRTCKRRYYIDLTNPFHHKRGFCCERCFLHWVYEILDEKDNGK